MARALHIAVLEPYYGGSHAAFVDAIQRHSRHHLSVVTLPARKWKWRMRGASIWFRRTVGEWARGEPSGTIDAIFCNDMLSVADLRALLPAAMRNVLIVCYFHENQLTYPVPRGQQRDFQYGMTNITSCLAADAVWFNSRFHLDEFVDAAERLLRLMPDFVPLDVLPEIRGKSEVMPPPVSLAPGAPPRHRRDRRCTILWCHRWEYDKSPEPFFEALFRLDAAGHDFDLVLLGEQFREAPPVFKKALGRLRRHVIHTGYIGSPDEHRLLLSRCDLVVSTAIQENLGFGVIEAVLAGCQPLLPHRLVYPEIIPTEFHAACLYPSDGDLAARLGDLLAGRGWLRAEPLSALQSSLRRRFGADVATARIDAAFTRLAAARQSGF